MATPPSRAVCVGGGMRYKVGGMGYVVSGMRYKVGGMRYKVSGMGAAWFDVGRCSAG